MTEKPDRVVVRKTSLNEAHHNLKAKMVNFHGWELPIWYTSILEEHRAVRGQVGMFDVSHMGRILLAGKDAGLLLDKILTKPAQQLKVGCAQLSLMCLENGGILDDLCVYRVETNKYLVVWNASNTEVKVDWLRRWSTSYSDIEIVDISVDTAMVAIQGPKTCQLKNLKAFSTLPRFGHAQTKIGELDVLTARTGYTGEDGFEIITDASNALTLWESFLEHRVKPCGLGARDSLRLEAGLLLYGQDMDISTNPFEAGLSWLVDPQRDFVGKNALLEIRKKGLKRKLVGFQIEGREIARTGYSIFKSDEEVGRVASGGYAPTLGVNIGLGYVPVHLAKIGTEIQISIRNKRVNAHIVQRPFYKKGVQDRIRKTRVCKDC